MSSVRETRNAFVSVIVPVWNDAERLAGCLHALEEQTYADELYEVIVVDNHPEQRDGEAGQKIAQLVSVNAHSRVVHERRPGSYAARNAGVAVAQGEIIAFTDADCIPASDWIERGVAHLTALEANCAVVAGHVEIFPRVAAQPNAIEQYEQLIALPQKEFVRKYGFGATANLFTFRKVLAQAGDFLAEVKSGGDLEWGRRVTGYGYKLEYCEKTRVFHPARASFAELYTKIVRVAGGHHDLKRLKGSAYLEFDRSWLLDLVPPVRAMAQVMREPSLFRWRDRIKVCTVLCFVRLVQAFEKSRLAFPTLWNHHTTTR
ncbi:MAG TPA: glycosyltransferase family A protein [Pyrinomonadaceae bacterium]|nr:glycosyltransferase family A protein [Pyrinomonadaceae bacterium]